MERLPPEIESVIGKCWQHAKDWEAPPKWALKDWQEELLAQARAAGWEAYVAYDPTRGVPLEAFVFIKVREALRTYWRKE